MMKNTNNEGTKSMTKYYLTTKATGGPTLSILPTTVTDSLTLSTELTAAGWRIAEYENTGLGVFVRPKVDHLGGYTSRWLGAWGLMVTDFEVRSIETIANSDGVIIAAMGAPVKTRMYTNSDCLKNW